MATRPSEHAVATSVRPGPGLVLHFSIRSFAALTSFSERKTDWRALMRSSVVGSRTADENRVLWREV
jgi:hypothetical protein